jgi:glycosyltransferase involved in cell wall biosynthesis
MDVSVIIPTYQRPERLGACLRALAGQRLAAGTFEVLVGLDGPDAASQDSAAGAWQGSAGLEVVTCRRQGYNGVRNELLRRARGRLMVSLNDDVLPEPGFLEAHAAAHRATAGRPVIVSGYSPFRIPPGDTLFDRLARETSMVFFYDQMIAPASPFHASRPADHDWGFRHCWGLNFSAPLAAVREVGGFTAFPLCYGYDDIEIAFRLRARFGTPVLFRPEARADHDHRYGPRDVLDREFKLGGTAWRFAAVNPAFGLEVFGRDIRSRDELEYSRSFIERERKAAERLERSFLDLTGIPAAAVSGPDATRLVNLIYEQHLLLKRWWWRKGLLAAASSEP